MTVIALLGGHPSPMLISDMLLSKERPIQGEQGRVFLPALGHLDAWEIESGIRLPFEATRMVRKPFSISASVHIAWAGPISAGRAFRENLLALYKEQRFTAGDFQEAIDRLSLVQQREFSAIAVHLPSEDEREKWLAGINVYSHRCQTYQSQRWGKCYFGGSGSGALRELVEVRDKQWKPTNSPDTYGLTAELVCAKLIFNESLIQHSPSKNEAAKVLHDGCGGFFEAQRFAPGGVVVPRNAFHLNLKVNAAGQLELTRFYIYFTRAIPEYKGRMALVCSPVDLPLQLLRNSEHTEVEFPKFDFIGCPPVWDENAGQEHMHFTSDTPVIEFEKDLIPGAVAVSIFDEDAPISTERLGRLDLDMQLQVLEYSTSISKQMAYMVDPADPDVILKASGPTVALKIRNSWLQELIDRFRGTMSEEIYISSL